MPSRAENRNDIASGCRAAGERQSCNLSILTVVACATEGENDLKKEALPFFHRSTALRYICFVLSSFFRPSPFFRCLIFQSGNKIRGREIFEPRKTIHPPLPPSCYSLLRSGIVVFLGCQNVPLIDYTGNLYKAVPRLGECCRQVEAEEVSNSRNKIHQTWEWPYRDSL